ncbi:MAG: cytochrome c [Kiloniellales bacterium]
MARKTRIGPLSASLFVAVSLAAGAALLPAQADDNPDVKARIELMKALGNSMKTMGPMFKGTVDYDPAAVREAAAAIEIRSGIELTKLFPEGSTTDKSAALPAIWTDWERFTKLADDLGFYAQGLVNSAGNDRTAPAASSGGTLGDAAPKALTTDPAELAAMSPDVVFQALGKTCGTCHTDFRKEKK